MWVESQLNPHIFLQNQEREHKQSSDYSLDKKVTWDLEGEKKIDQLLQPKLPDLNDMTRWSSNRQLKPSIKAEESQDKVVQRMFGLVTNVENKNANKTTPIMMFMTHLENLKSLFDETINECHFDIYNTVASSNDAYTLKEMLKLKDVKEFVAAMLKKIADHEERNHWVLMKRVDLPKGAKSIFSVWALKIKRLPDGTITRHKARLNAHGSIQCWGIDYWET